MSIIKEFKEFALKGNVMDLAVGVIIGTAFGKIIDSLVKDIIMPFAFWVVGGDVDFSNLFFILGDNPNGVTTLANAKAEGLNIFAYGNFLTIAINFFLLALVVFFLVKGMNKLRHQKAAPSEATAPPVATEDIQLLREIRDELKKHSSS